MIGRSLTNKYLVQVLQEAAAARRIVVMDGLDEMDGDSFCLGLEALNSERRITFSSTNASHRAHAATLLMKSAGLRSRMSPSIKTLLGTRSIAELVNTFHSHEATDRRDKVFALLGLGANVPMELSANYDISWGEVFRRLIRCCIGNSEAYIETWDDQEIAIMKPEVMVLGHFVAGRGFARGSVEEELHIQFCGEERKRFAIPWNRERTALPPREGDILCLLPGATRPTIIRPLQLHTYVYCAIISIVESPNGRLSNDEDCDEEWYVGFASEQGRVDSRVTNRLRHIKESPLFLTECWVVWDWGVLEAGTVEDSASGRGSVLAQFRPLEPESTGITAERATAHIELMARSEIRRLPETFQDMVSTHENFGRLLALAGHETEARDILRPVIKYYDDVFGPTSPQTVTAIRRISEIYRESGDSASEDATAWSAEVISRSGRCLRITEATLWYCFERSTFSFGEMRAERRMKTLCKFREKEVGQIVTQAVLEAAYAYGDGMMEALLRCVMKADATVPGINTAQLVKLAVTASPWPWFDFQKILPLMLKCEHIANKHDKGVLVSLKAFEDLVGRERLDVEIVGDPWDEPFEKANCQGVVGFILDRLGDRIAKDVRQLILVETAGTLTGRPAKYDASLQMNMLLDQWGDDVVITEEVMMKAVAWDESNRQMTKLLVGRYEGRVPVTERVLCAAVVNTYDGGQALEALTHHQGVTPEITELVLETAAKYYYEGGYGWTGSIRDPLLLLLDKCRGDPPVTKRVLVAVMGNSLVNRVEVFGTLLDVLDEKLASHGETTAYQLFKLAASNSEHGYEYIRMLVEGYGDQGPLTDSDASELLRYAARWQETGDQDEKPAFLLHRPTTGSDDGDRLLDEWGKPY